MRSARPGERRGARRAGVPVVALPFLAYRPSHAERLTALGARVVLDPGRIHIDPMSPICSGASGSMPER